MNGQGKILIVDDDLTELNCLEHFLTKSGFKCVSTTHSSEALELTSLERPDIVVTDLNMPGRNGMDVLNAVKRIDSNIVVILQTGYGTINSAVKAMKSGAFDYLQKPFSSEQLLETIERAAHGLNSSAHSLDRSMQIDEAYRFDDIIGQSEAMKKIFKKLVKIAESDANVMIYGESGTGKEMVARCIHAHSKRKLKQYIPVDCVALPETLLESELFGYEKGAFTGASGRRIGKFEVANGGTIFLDEIGLMSQMTQAKLLRVLQEREFERVGGNDLVKVDVRVISATNVDLEEAVKNGTFREDLFYRISVFPIRLPSLRERKEDIPLLAAHFLEKYCTQEKKAIEGIAPDALELLMAYSWPGNVRELENAIERATLLATTVDISPKDLPNSVRAIGEKKIYEKDATLSSWIEKLEEDALRQALLECEGNISKTAKKLGIGRATIYRKAKKYGLPMIK
jgi:two-component system response regulator AtoC